jgi:hypothetical protein
VRRRRFAENDPDARRARVNDPLDIGAAKRAVIFAVSVAVEFRQNKIGYLFDKLFIIAVYHIFY